MEKREKIRARNNGNEGISEERGGEEKLRDGEREGKVLAFLFSLWKTLTETKKENPKKPT